MAAFTTIATASALAISAGMATKGIIDKKKAQKDLDNLETPELKNAFKDMKISTVGSDLIKEEGQRTVSSLIDASRSSGASGVNSSIPKIVALSNDMNNKAAAQIDDQIINREYSIAQEEGKIRRIKENRYAGDVQGLGQAISASEQNIWNGIRGIGTGLSALSRTGGSTKTRDSATSISSSSPLATVKPVASNARMALIDPNEMKPIIT